ncbi:DUF2279 domain-containing protein [Sulfurimonas sediminis]|uniref:DUF2279 domain-containing protein n=1 Tax=Sulfurimonas sediminis TaxID=2590020 RepID=A0A7M1AZ86_9BACT|nr:DUF2279 domain-containing protein [Sulfurimonas sediminis]QOP42685.1 DUF2279 domain-containing protein [Sulfurimonas sediminis]
MLFKSMFLFLFVMLQTSNADWAVNSAAKTVNDYTLLTKDQVTGAVIDNLAVDVMIAAWGYKYWKWGKKSFHFQTEPWFEKDSKTGGSDKTGHLYMTYLLSRVLASRMQDRGWSLQKSSLFGALSGMLSMTLLEVGDGTSNYGFSKEDLAADALGAGLAYLIRAYPRADDFIDIRLEYLPTSDYLKGGDNTTDYSGMKHLVAFKMSGFDSLKNSYWSLLEFQVGYYARGYRSFDTQPQSQHIYAGVGISLANLAKRTNINILKNLFEFYQPGHTYIEQDLWSR